MNIYDTIAENISDLLAKKKMRVADLCRINSKVRQSSLSKFLLRNQDAIRLDELIAIAEALNEPLNNIFGDTYKNKFNEEIDTTSIDSNTVLIPFYDMPASAGYGSLFGGDVPYVIVPFDKRLLPFPASSDSLFMQKIEGDSMSPTFYSGDVVIFQKIEHISFIQDNIYLVEDDFSGCKIKRLSVDKNGNIYVKSDNKKYDTVTYTKEDIENGRLRILGIFAMFFSKIVRSSDE